MISYELALKLKDAGFPQGTVNHPVKGLIPREEWNDSPKIPSLSELLDACGDELISLSPAYKRFNRLSRGNVLWYAIGVHDKNRNGKVTCLDDTPEEAVAKLWIELQKK